VWSVYYPAVVPLEDLREMNRDGRVWGAGLTLKNSHESVTVSMAFNAQLTRSIDENLLCVFYQYLIKEDSTRCSPLCLSDDDESLRKVLGVVHMS